MHRRDTFMPLHLEMDHNQTEVKHLSETKHPMTCPLIPNHGTRKDGKCKRFYGCRAQGRVEDARRQDKRKGDEW